MRASIQDAVVSMILAGVVLFVAVQAGRITAHLRQHHSLSNRRFVRRYRTGFLSSARTAVETSTSSDALPEARPRTSTDAGNTQAMPIDPMPGRCSG